MNKTLYSGLLLTGMLLTLPPSSLAQGVPVLPGDVDYQEKRALESQRIAQGSSALQRARANMDSAAARLEEMEALAADGRHGQLGELAREYEGSIDEAMRLLHQVPDEEAALTEMARAMEQQSAENTERLNALMEQSPDAATPGLTRAINASMRGREQAQQNRLREEDRRAAVDDTVDRERSRVREEREQREQSMRRARERAEGQVAPNPENLDRVVPRRRDRDREGQRALGNPPGL